MLYIHKKFKSYAVSSPPSGYDDTVASILFHGSKILTNMHLSIRFKHQSARSGFSTGIIFYATIPCADAVVMVDFNYGDINWEGFTWPHHCDSFMDILLDWPIHQQVFSATHILDLVFVTTPDVISEIKINAGLGSSDHLSVTFQLSVGTHQPKDTASCPAVNVWRTDWRKLMDKIQASIIFLPDDSAESYWHALKKLIHDSLQHAAPRFRRQNTRRDPPW